MIEKIPAKQVNNMVWPFLETCRNRLLARSVSFANVLTYWIPAFAGMTELMDYLKNRCAKSRLMIDKKQVLSIKNYSVTCHAKRLCLLLGSTLSYASRKWSNTFA